MPRLSKCGEARQQAFLTLEELSKLSGVSVRVVWKACNGKIVSFSTAKAIAKALGVDPEVLR